MFVMLTLPEIGSRNRLPLWFTVLVISRDVAIVATVAVINLAMGPRTFRPSIYGKIATALYIMTGVVTLYFNYSGEPSASSGRSSTPRSPSLSFLPATARSKWPKWAITARPYGFVSQVAIDTA